MWHKIQIFKICKKTITYERRALSNEGANKKVLSNIPRLRWVAAHRRPNEIVESYQNQKNHDKRRVHKRGSSNLFSSALLSIQIEIVFHRRTRSEDSIQWQPLTLSSTHVITVFMRSIRRRRSRRCLCLKYFFVHERNKKKSLNRFDQNDAHTHSHLAFLIASINRRTNGKRFHIWYIM